MMTTINRTCATCKKDYELGLRKQDLIRFEQGAHIQDVMPYLSADERELLISGICGKCFDEMFTDEDGDA